MKIAVIGGGASGMMSAISAAEQGAQVVLYEKNEKTGKKLHISGKGRCNLTNDCSPRDFLSNVVTNGKFLQSAIYKFTPADTIAFCSELGLATKIERGNRVFPQSDKSSDVIKAFNLALQRSGAEVRLNCAVLSVKKRTDGGFCVATSVGEEHFDRVIIATGGYSYRATGSDGFGYKLAQSFRHTVMPLHPALCRVLCDGTKSLEGLSLKNVQVSYINKEGKRLASEFGEMLFTDDGVSGPAVLSLSSQINKVACGGKIVIDLKPALDVDTLDARVLRDFSERMNKNFENSLDGLLPERLIAAVVAATGIDGKKKVNQISAKERAALVSTLKNLAFPFVGLDDINFGIVTSGGVSVAEINPSTMESKLVDGLYFCGEVLDVDAYTGGFNIQIALSTGRLAGVSAAIK